MAVEAVGVGDGVEEAEAFAGLAVFVLIGAEVRGEGWAVEVDEFVWSVVPVLGDIGFDTPEEEVALVWGDIGDDEVFSGVEFIEAVEVLAV